MRIGRGCERCRHRHIRCTVRAGASSCNACARLDRPCRLDPRFRFKTVRHVYHKSHGTPSRFELAWEPEQVWVNYPRSLTFIQEPADESSEWSAESPKPRPAEEPVPLLPPSFPEPSLEMPDLAPMNDSGLVTPPMVSDCGPAVVSTAISPPSVNGVASPLASTNSWAGTSSWESFSPRPITSATLSPREAYLMRIFISRIAPWADICDLQSHFTTEVPRRALQVPMVLKAVLSLSARHDAIMSGSSDVEASEYHGQCLELLIAVLAQPEGYDDNLLITVVILRFYEELENITDEKYHLLGSNRLLNTMSKSASSGGLAEAVSWQFLRQAIYASVVQYQPMSLDLENYEHSTVFQRSDDAAYANVIIFLCARVIQLCARTDTEVMDEAAWHQIAHSVEHWHRARPISWQPLRYRSADPAENRPFPELWMMSPPAVVGLQYYHASCIFLTSSDGHWQTVSDYELARLRRVDEVSIVSATSVTPTDSIENNRITFGYGDRPCPVERNGRKRILHGVPLGTSLWILSSAPGRTARVAQVPSSCGKTRWLANSMDGGGTGTAVAGVIDDGFVVVAHRILIEIE